MLSKKNRLPRLALEDVKSSSARVNSDHFTLLYKNSENATPRFGVIISKKISKKAVVRNRIKRAFYSIVRESLSGISPNISCVFVARPGIEEKLNSLGPDVLHALKRAKIIE